MLFKGRSFVRNCQGFTVIELALNVVVIAIFLSMVVPAGLNLLAQAREQTVLQELDEIAKDIEIYFVQNNTYPDSLTDVYVQEKLDPWNNPYQYLKILGGAKNKKGKIRKNKKNKQINNRFDLYSMGPDGESVAPLTGGPSQDDAIYADDGGFIGFVEDYY